MRGSEWAAGYDLSRWVGTPQAVVCSEAGFVAVRTAHACISRSSLILIYCCRGSTLSAQDTVIPAQGKALVKTGLSIAIPINTYARIGKMCSTLLSPTV